MFWIFATAVLVLAVKSPGFRKFLGWSTAAIVGLWVLLEVISVVLG
jgi:hypothetical protein